MPGDPRNLMGPIPPGFGDEPSPLAADAVALHELFETLLAAGFTQRQACVILGSAIGVQTNERKKP